MEAQAIARCYCLQMTRENKYYGTLKRTRYFLEIPKHAYKTLQYRQIQFQLMMQFGKSLRVIEIHIQVVCDFKLLLKTRFYNTLYILKQSRLYWSSK